ncbi:MAG: response regulator transcription factor [Flavobacteriales bacterium]|nr:response regulator transcription factor [Flavobacteriales bacterium]
MKASKILLVDDEKDIIEFLKYNLSKEGYEVAYAYNGKDAIKKVNKFDPDLILLDVMMPEMDGIEVCRELRSNKRFKDVIIAFLTARGEDYSQIAGFEAGADDYIAKPIKPRVLSSRVAALLRRNNQKNEQPKEVSGITVDRERYLAIINGEEAVLPRKEFELLDLLISKPGKVFTREKILSDVWGSDVVVGDRTIDVHIRKLREKIGEEKIVTVKGVGYKLESE